MRRAAARSVLWNGNRERPVTLWRATHPVCWSWRTHRRHRAEYEQRLADPRWAHLTAVHLRTAREARRWLRGLPGAPPLGSSGPP